MLIGDAASLIEICVHRGELFWHPTGSEPGDESATREDVQSREHLGVEHGMPERQNQHAHSDFDACCGACDVAERGYSFQNVLR